MEGGVHSDSYSSPYKSRNVMCLKQYDSNTLQNLMLVIVLFYRGADKSFARPVRKQATATEDFDFNISYL